EGGRLLYMGEFEGYFSAADFDIENNFLAAMGAVMRNVRRNYACSALLPSSKIMPHDLTAGVTSFQVACASEVQLVPDDYPLFIDALRRRVLGAGAKIDLTPIALGSRAPLANRIQTSGILAAPASGFETGVDPARVRKPKPLIDQP